MIEGSHVWCERHVVRVLFHELVIKNDQLGIAATQTFLSRTFDHTDDPHQRTSNRATTTVSERREWLSWPFSCSPIVSIALCQLAKDHWITELLTENFACM